MVDDVVYRRLVSALHVLVKGAGSRDDNGWLLQHARQCEQTIAAVCAEEAHVILQERSGDLYINGRRLLRDFDVFMPLLEIAEGMRARRVHEVLFEAGCAADELHRIAVWFHQGGGEPPACAHLHIGLAAADEAPHAPNAADGTADAQSLRSLVLLNELVGCLGPHSGVPLACGALVVRALIDTLNREPEGLRLIQELQADRPLLHHSVHVAVLSALIARGLGWPEERLHVAAVAGLFHDLGRLAAGRGDPAIAGFRRLIAAAGDRDLFLHCALAARLRPAVHGRRLAEMPADGSLLAAIVAVANRFDELAREQHLAAEVVLTVLRDDSACGRVPIEVVGALEAALTAPARTLVTT